MQRSSKILLVPLFALALSCIIGCQTTEFAHFAGSMVGAAFDGAAAGLNNTQPGTKYQEMFAAAAVQDVLRSEAREAGVNVALIPADWQSPDGQLVKDSRGMFCYYLGDDHLAWNSAEKCWKTED
jgi:hypothetical protein